METWKNDAVFALRSWTRSPGLMLAAVVCMGLCIGATSTVYSVTRAIVHNPVPVPRGQRVLRLTEVPPNSPATVDGVAPATFLEWQHALKSYQHLAAFQWSSASLTGVGDPERVPSARVTPAFFSILSRAPLHGRILVDADLAAGGQVVVLSHGLWTRRFGGNPDVVGRHISLNGVAHEIVGVMPAEFVFPQASELWVPLVLPVSAASDRAIHDLHVLGTLERGTSVAQASAEVAALARTVAARFPAARHGWTALAEPVQQYYGNPSRGYMRVALLAVLLVLLIGCANVANLLLARATSRERELAVRVALGGSGLRIARLLFTESAVLALFSGVTGVLLALWGVLLFRNSIPAELLKFNPGWSAIRVDGPTLLFALLIALGSSLCFGLLPAIQAARESVNGIVRHNSRTTVTSRVQGRTRSVLVVGEVGLALMLVVSTGLMLHSFRSLLAAETGFQREHVLSMQLSLPAERYPLAEQRAEFYSRLEEKLGALPGVEAVGLVNVLPMDWSETATRLTHGARPNATEGEMPVVRLRTVSDDYFRTLQIPLLRGRHFDARDHRSGSRVAIVSERLAQQLWPGLDPLGKQVRQIGEHEWLEVIGVVADIRHNPNLGEALQPTLHLPLRQTGARSTAIVLRSAGSATALAPAAQRAIATLDPALAAGDVRTLERVIYNALAPQRTTAGMLGAFGVVALILACVGVYGVVSYSMARRAGELGLRVALGARQTDVIRLVLRHGATLTGAGVLLGLAGTWILARAMRGLMFATEPPSALTFVLGVLLLTGTALLACFQPARRAATTDPTTLLRRE